MFKKLTLLLALVAAFCFSANAAKVSYEVSFKGAGALPADWTVLDNSATTGSSWYYDKSFAAVSNTESKASKADDYFVSPAFELEAGVIYNLKTMTTSYWGMSAGNLTLKVGTSATDASTFADVQKLAPQGADENTFTTEEITYTPAASGTYYFAFHSDMDKDGMGFILGGFAIEGGEEGGSTEEPEGGEGFAYAAEFSAGSDEAWTVVDNNADGVKYIYDTTMGAEEAAMCVNTGGATASIDDYYVSPAFNLNAGVAYSIKALVANLYGSCSGNVSLVAGAADAELSSYETIGQLTCAVVYSLADAVAEEFTFTPTADGKYKFAFYTSGQSSYLTPYVKGFSIEGASGSLATEEEPEQPVEPEEPEQPELAGPFTITENFDDDSHFTASTTVPDGWKSEGSYWPFQRSSSYEYGYAPKSGSYSFNTLNATSVSSRDEVFYTPLIKLVAGKECKMSFYVYSPGGSLNAFYHILTVKAGTAQTADAQTIEVGTVNQVCSDWTEFTFSFTPETEGEYCFSVALSQSVPIVRDHGVTLIDDVTITGEAPEAGEGPEQPEVVPVELPYAIDFTETAEGWTALDLSTSGSVTWGYDENGYFYGGYKPSVAIDYGVHNDYWISPAFTLEAGKTYKVVSKSTNMDRGSSVLTLQLGTDAADAATFKSFATLNPSTAYADYANQPTEENTFTVEESGVYYLAFHLLTNSEYTDKGYDLLSFELLESGNSSQEEPEPEAPKAELPYAVDFTAGAASDWSVIDVTGGDTWRFAGDGYMASAPAVTINNSVSSNTTAFDDYYVSPAFALEAGKTYVVKTRTSNPWATATFTLELGTSVAKESTYNVIATLSPAGFDPTYDSSTVGTEEFEVTVDESGEYFLAFHVEMPANWVGPSLVGFAIEEKVAVTPEPEPVVAELPYEIDFTATQEGWNAVDKSETPGTTWAVATGTAMGGSYTTVKVATDFNSATDDYYVSPAFSFEEGAKYKVSVKAFDPVWSGTHAEFSILYGNSADNVTAYSTIAEKIAVDYNTYDNTGNGASKLPVIEYEFTSEFTGQCCVALHVASLVGIQNTEIFTFAIQKTADAPQPDPLYAFGAFNGWDPLNSVEFTYVDGVYVLENIELAGDKNFGLATIQTSDWNALASYRYGFKQDNAVATEGEAMAIVQGTGAIKAPATGVYNIVVDMSAMTVTLNWVDYLPELYVFGNVGTSHWSTTEGVALAHIGEGVYKGVVDVAGAGEFTFVTVRGASWDDVNKDVRYGSLSAGQQLSVDETTDAEVSMTNDKWGSTTNWKLAAGTYTMTVDIVNCTLKVELGDKVGVENVVVDVVEPIYFNLQGVQVANPEAGNLYIVVRGNKVSKEIKF